MVLGRVERHCRILLDHEIFKCNIWKSKDKKIKFNSLPDTVYAGIK